MSRALTSLANVFQYAHQALGAYAVLRFSKLGYHVAVHRVAMLLALAACSRGGDGLVDLDDHAVDRLPLGANATVVVFLASNCPISTRYLPELGRIRARFAERGIAFDAVYPDGDEPVAEIRAHARDLGSGYLVLRDPRHALARRTGATVTPEAAVLGPRGELLYRGRIDDWYLDFGRSRPAAVHHDLQDAIEAVLAGRTPAAGGAPIGCAITE
jgi:hypothetical protein